MYHRIWKTSSNEMVWWPTKVVIREIEELLILHFLPSFYGVYKHILEGNVYFKRFVGNYLRWCMVDEQAHLPLL